MITRVVMFQLPGGEPGVAGDHRVGQQTALVEGGGQFFGDGDLTTLTGLGRAGELPEGDSADLVVAGDQVSRAGTASGGGDLLRRRPRRRAAQRLAAVRWSTSDFIDRAARVAIATHLLARATAHPGVALGAADDEQQRQLGVPPAAHQAPSAVLLLTAGPVGWTLGRGEV